MNARTGVIVMAYHACLPPCRPPLGSVKLASTHPLRRPSLGAVKPASSLLLPYAARHVLASAAGLAVRRWGRCRKQSAAASPALHNTSVGRAWICKKDIAEIFSHVGGVQFDLLEEEVSLDPHDEDNNYMYSCFRSRSGGRLTREIVDEDFVLVGDDKCGLSAVFDVQVPPGATLSVQMSTWVNPRHSGFGVEESSCFGVGMVPYGCGKVQEWLRDEFQTCIEDGVQYYCAFAWEEQKSDDRKGPGSLGGLAGLLELARRSPDSMMRYTLDVVQGGSSIHHSKQTKLSLEMIDVRLRRDASGETELSFAHGAEVFKVKRPAQDAHMQLYFNCLGWADNMTYVQIHKVAYDPPLCDRNASERGSGSKKRASEEDFPDYSKILRADPQLRKQVDELIKNSSSSR